MSQSKRQSLSEAVFNTAVGYGVNFTANLIVLPCFGFNVTLKQNLILGVIFTLISIARGYCVRRLFDRIT